MDFILKHNAPDKARGACQIITVSERRKLSASGKLVDKASKGFLAAVLRRGDMDGKAGRTLLLSGIPNSGAERVLLVGCGKDDEMNERVYSRVIGAIADTLHRRADQFFDLADLEPSICRRS